MGVDRDRLRNCFDSFDLRPMADFVEPHYSKRDVVSAGKLLSGRITWLDDGVHEAFRIAHNWRAAFAYPMHRVRHELAGKVRRGGRAGITAGRLKRMTSVRRKLSSSPITLYQMQDIAGVRAIVPSIEEVGRVASYFESGDSNHSLKRVNDYISNPKPDGYRSLHLILKFQGLDKEAVFNRQSVEVQIRTQRQHVWATALEAVGLVRGENLKAGQGSKQWLRFFEIMSAEIALREGQPIPPSVSNQKNMRLDELRSIERDLNAVREMEGYREVLDVADSYRAAGNSFFLLDFNQSEQSMTVSPYSNFRQVSSAYDAQDQTLVNTNAVLVEVDKLHDLKSAYPNYFLDVKEFIDECKMSMSGYNHDSLKKMDFSWLKTWRRKD